MVRLPYGAVLNLLQLIKDMPLTLISHALCPYVQRAAIVLTKKGLQYDRKDVDLSNKPDWFLQCSPLGKTPVLLVKGVAIFESAVICEFLDETFSPRLHPESPLERARHRALIEFGSALLNNIGAFYSAKEADRLVTHAKEIRSKFEYIESELEAGPYFRGVQFSIVDAVFGPIFRYFDLFDEIDDFGFFINLPKVCAWRASLAARPSVRNAVSSAYPQLLLEFLRNRPSYLAIKLANAELHNHRLQELAHAHLEPIPVGLWSAK